jgi:hypothetical protein
MNLFLHGVGPDDNDREPPIKTEDALVDVFLSGRHLARSGDMGVVKTQA